jgi:hypothetical protein
VSVMPGKFVIESREKSNRRFFAYHPRTEKRPGPRALRMTLVILMRTSNSGR